MEVTQELVRNYLLEQRGRVRNSDLLKKFKPLLESSDPQEKASNREIFKRYVNKIAVVRDEDGSKVVVLKKKYTHLLAANRQDLGEEGSNNQGEGPDNPSVSDRLIEEAKPSPDHDVLPQENLSEPHLLGLSTPHHEGLPQENLYVPQHPELSTPHHPELSTPHHEGLPQGNLYVPQHPEPSTPHHDVLPQENLSEPHLLELSTPHHEGLPQENLYVPQHPELSTPHHDVLPQENLSGPRHLELSTADHEGLPQENLSGPHGLIELSEHGGGESLGKSTEAELGSLNELVSSTPSENEGERESVFAIVARMDHSGPAPVPKSWSVAQAKDVQKPAMLPLRYIQTSFDNLESENNLVPSAGVQEAHAPDLSQTTSSPFVKVDPLPVLTRSPNVSRKQLDDIGSKSPHIKRSSKMMKVNEDNKYSEAVPLIQHEHEWLVNATNGRWNHKLLGLMMIDSDLADKRDFISGFSALHWAAKSGNTEMVKLLFDLSRKGGSNVNVNGRSFGGYTPLHIAAIHDHKEVINLLVGEYNAKVYIRDNSGRKPYHYLKKGSPMQLRNLLKDPTAISPDHGLHMKRNSKVATSILGTTNAFFGVISDDLAFQDLTRGLKKPASLNKFFTAPAGAKKKLKARDSYPAISSLCEDPEEMEEVVVKRRPVSEFFTH